MRLQVTVGAARDRGYPIDIVQERPEAPLPTVLSEVLSPAARRLLLVTDDNVAPLYAEPVEAALVEAGYAVTREVLVPGEATKTLGNASRIIDRAFDAKLSRSDAMVALGGGVVGDITGFAASIFLRGIDVVQVPTTLLAQVDSSVGGKTAVNHATGKNLIGAFWHPRAVVASGAVLATLPPREVRCGLAEAIKHGFIADRELSTWMVREAEALLALEPSASARLVEACCRIKSAVVAEDPEEDPSAGRRAVLNFGHTFGHAYERLLGYGRWTHGEAVAVGMVWAARLSERLGVGKRGLEREVVASLARFGLPCDPGAGGLPSLTELIEAARGDKKARGDGVRFVLLERVGVARIERLGWSAIEDALA